MIPITGLSPIIIVSVKGKVVAPMMNKTRNVVRAHFFLWLIWKIINSSKPKVRIEMDNPIGIEILSVSLIVSFIKELTSPKIVEMTSNLSPEETWSGLFI